jgi:hypothetical protein
VKKVKLNDVIKEAEYADIILSLLVEPYQLNSVTKMIFFAFCIKYEDNFASYRNRTKDFVDVFFENISLKLATNYKDIGKILCVLKMLVKVGKISIKEDNIQVLDELKYNSENEFIKMCSRKKPNPILEINKLDAIAVIEEVIRYV